MFRPNKKQHHSEQKVLPSLLSIHIPKTAGQTFRYFLEQAYGKGQVLHVNQGWLSRNKTTISALHPDRYKVLHGHLPYRHYLTPYNLSGVRVVTFLRDPVERVLSNFHYYQRKKEERRNAGKSVRHYYDLETYIELEERQNVMTRFLEGIELEAIFSSVFRNNSIQMLPGWLKNWIGICQWRFFTPKRTVQRSLTR